MPKCVKKKPDLREKQGLSLHGIEAKLFQKTNKALRKVGAA
jgi:hypothetical protein